MIAEGLSQKLVRNRSMKPWNKLSNWRSGEKSWNATGMVSKKNPGEEKLGGRENSIRNQITRNENQTSKNVHTSD